MKDDPKWFWTFWLLLMMPPFLGGFLFGAVFGQHMEQKYGKHNDASPPAPATQPWADSPRVLHLPDPTQPAGNCARAYTTTGGLDTSGTSRTEVWYWPDRCVRCQKDMGVNPRWVRSTVEFSGRGLLNRTYTLTEPMCSACAVIEAGRDSDGALIGHGAMTSSRP